MTQPGQHLVGDQPRGRGASLGSLFSLAGQVAVVTGGAGAIGSRLDMALRRLESRTSPVGCPSSSLDATDPVSE